MTGTAVMTNNERGGVGRMGRAVTQAARWIYHLLVVFLLLGLGGELFARFGLGLGDPPLTIIHPQIGYMSAPNQDVRRFGNQVAYNAFGMRSDHFPPQKSSPDELRIIFIGDSVLNGGSVLDQRQIATELLKNRLAAQLNKPVVVGNISAGGWSPSNELNYVQHYGLFDADLVVLVQSSHDARGDEGFAKLKVNFPTRRPTLAMSELVERYSSHILPQWLQTAPAAPAPEPPLDIDDLKQLIQMARDAGADVILAQHPDRNECHGEWAEGYELIRQACVELQVSPLINLRPAYKQAILEGTPVYRDGIHLSAQGQRILADTLEPAIMQTLTTRLTSTPPQARSDQPDSAD